MLSSTLIDENYTSLLDVHEQRQEEVPTVSDYDNRTQTCDLSDYDNNTGSNVNVFNVSMLLIIISSHFFE